MPVLMVLNLFFIVFALINLGRIGQLKVLLLYALVSFFRYLVDIYFNVFEEHSETAARQAARSLRLFMLIEFVLFYRFIAISLRSATAKKCLRILLLVFVLTALGCWLAGGQITSALMNLSMAQSYFIIFPILYYYYELLHHPPAKNIMKAPRFWVLTGMLFLFILIMPLAFQSGALLVTDKPVRYLYTLNFIGYIILFLFFINALRWQLQAPNT